MSVNVVNKSTGALTKVAGNAITEASGINYSHTTSGMSATNVQDAIDESYGELKSGLTTLDNEVNGDSTTYPYADVITIEDAIPANLADCGVKIEPVQDLHGYDYPWVGGAGKNKLPLVLADIKANNTLGTWSGNAYTYKNTTITVLTDNDGNVIGFNVDGTVGSGGISFYIINNVTIPYNGTYKFTTTNGLGSGVAVLDYIFSDTSQHTEVYTQEITKEISSNLTDMHIYLWSGKTFDNVVMQPMMMLSTETDATFAPYTNICPISGHTEASVTVVDDVESPTVTKTYTIALGDTIYGGTVDFNTGVMTVDRVCYEFDGSETWTKRSGANSYQHIENLNIINAWDLSPVTAISNLCKQNGNGAYYGAESSFGYTTSNNILYVGAPSIESAEDFKTYLSNNPLQIVGTLDTPTTVQLTPQQIQLLKGQNTLTASTGQISVTANGVSGSIGAVQEQVNSLGQEVNSIENNIAGLKFVRLGSVANSSGISINYAVNNPSFLIIGKSEVNGVAKQMAIVLTVINGIIEYGRTYIFTDLCGNYSPEVTQTSGHIEFPIGTYGSVFIISGSDFTAEYFTT